MKKSSTKRNKERSGIVYSTNPEFEYTHDDPPVEKSLPPDQQTLYVSLDRKGRKGKTVTIVSGFIGTADDRKEIARFLKSTCNSGGSIKGDEILIQGNFRDRIIQILHEAGYATKRKGG